MKNHLLVSLLLMQFHLDAAHKTQKSIAKKQRITTSSVPFITEHTIKPLLASDTAFLMIGADWCTHCKTMQPLFFESYQNDKNTIKYGFLPLGNSFSESTQIIRALEKKYSLQIDAIPMILIFKKNQLIDQIRGAMTRDQLAALVKKHTTPSLTPAQKTSSSKPKKRTGQKN